MKKLNQFKSTLVNSRDAINFFSISPDFSSSKLNDVQSRVYHAIFGQSSSIYYRCFVAEILYRITYSDPLFSDVLKKINDVNFSSNLLIFKPISTSFSGDQIQVNTDDCFSNQVSQEIYYTIKREDSSSVVISSNISSTSQKISFSNEEILSSSSWKEVKDSGTRIKFSFNGSIPSDLFIQFEVFIPFRFNIEDCLGKLTSVDKLDPFIRKIGEEVREIEDTFSRSTRAEKRLSCVCIAQVLSLLK